MARGKKTGGRKKGSLNKTTRSMRETLGAFMDKKWPTVEKAFNRLKDKDKVFAFTKLLPFITPQYSSINFSLKNMTEQDLETIINHLKNSENEEQENGINGPD